MCVCVCVFWRTRDDVLDNLNFPFLSLCEELPEYIPTMASTSSVGDKQLQRIIRDLHGNQALHTYSKPHMCVTVDTISCNMHQVSCPKDSAIFTSAKDFFYM